VTWCSTRKLEEEEEVSSSWRTNLANCFTNHNIAQLFLSSTASIMSLLVFFLIVFRASGVHALGAAAKSNHHLRLSTFSTVAKIPIPPLQLRWSQTECQNHESTVHAPDVTSSARHVPVEISHLRHPVLTISYTTGVGLTEIFKIVSSKFKQRWPDVLLKKKSISPTIHPNAFVIDVDDRVVFSKKPTAKCIHLKMSSIDAVVRRRRRPSVVEARLDNENSPG
jgi:hypothetical protein